MAEENGQEKTEDATPRRLEKARKDGQVVRSKELNTTAILLAGAFGLMMFGKPLAEALEAALRYNFTLDRVAIFDEKAMLLHLGLSIQSVGVSLAPIGILLMMAAILGPISLGGWNFSIKALAPKFSRINPGSGLKRMFSANSMMELVKAIAKFLLVLGISLTVLKTNQFELMGLNKQAVVPAMAHTVSLLSWSFIFLCSSLILITVIDIPFQIREHANKLKMTMQQVKDEMKDSEGRPEVKGRIRQLQREMAQGRMMDNVPDADVIITNPTHYAVALKYDPENMGAPLLVAKGADLVAARIRELGVEHKIPILSFPPLARAVYHSTEVEREIPVPLYVSVAQVLAYVFQLRTYKKEGSAKPVMPSDLPIPDESEFMKNGSSKEPSDEPSGEQNKGPSKEDAG
ncbi:MAG: flagellar type III secretion system protein FlhB [Pseudomonadales bacterium]|nr:flagellar type III secretion system protein FlhB [Pseudomonadales bacterium]